MRVILQQTESVAKNKLDGLALNHIDRSAANG